MFHPDTQFLIDHWTTLARHPDARGGLPDRSAVRPEALGARLPRAFMAERSGGDAFLRLAGEWIESFHDAALPGRSLLSLWRTASRPLVASSLAQTIREGRPVVIAAAAGSAAAKIEVTILPLRGPGGRADRLLGLYAPAATLSLPANESRRLTARAAIGVGEAARAPLSLAALHGRRIA